MTQTQNTSQQDSTIRVNRDGSVSRTQGMTEEVMATLSGNR
jgi:hypothetical protein